MNKEINSLKEKDLAHLTYCLALAKRALKEGDKPFGSILVDSSNNRIAEARNRVNELNALAHPEYELAQWAADNLTTEERKNTTMYTTGEHCPMCAAAHGWVGLGPIVYLSSANQLNQWLKDANAAPSPITFHPVEDIIPNIIRRGPVSGELLEEIKQLQLAYHGAT